MFEVKKHKLMFKDFHRIVENRLVLFNDGDNDILYTGTNKYGNRLLSSIMFEDDEEGFLRYIYILVTEKQYANFLSQIQTLRSIIEQSQTVFLVDVDYSGNELEYNLIDLVDIPENFLPLKSSYCPDFIYDKSFSYSVSLLGGTADLHKAEAKELSDVGTHFSDFLSSSTEFLEDLRIKRSVYVEALRAGSFEINYKIEITSSEQVDLFPHSSLELDSFLSNYFKYFFNYLPKEKVDVFTTEEVDSEEFKKLEKELEAIYENRHALPPGGVEQKLIDLINYSARQIENVEYNRSFKEIKFQGKSSEGIQIPYAVINEDFIPAIKNKMFPQEFPRKLEAIETDNEPRDYVFRVFKFSSETGKGSAYYKDAMGNTFKIAVHAQGKDDYKNTLFTKSMDEGIPLTFKGIGEYRNGLLKKVICPL